MSYEKLFTPFKIGKMEVKNRLVMSPMGTNSALANGRKTDNEIDYFIERAKGGARTGKRMEFEVNPTFPVPSTVL